MTSVPPPDDARTKAAREPTRLRFGHPAWWVVVGVAAVAALLLNFAGALHLERLPVISGIVAPRNAMTAAGAGFAALVALIALVWRRSRRVLLPVALAIGVVIAFSTVSIVQRGVADQQPVAAQSQQLRVLSWNINGDLVSAAVVARVAAEVHANVVVLPQIFPEMNGRQFQTAFAAADLDLRPYPAISTHGSETVVFIATSVGSYQTAAAYGPEPERSALLQPTSPGLPTIVALHAAHPALSGNATWNAELRWVQSSCSHDDVIAVGDFNATLDSFGARGLGRCEDAATALGDGSVGTWPTAAPAWAGMPLDHILVSPGWSVASFTVLTGEDHSGARHRPIFAVLERTH